MSNLTRLAYCGAKLDGETAFQHDTGITWFPRAVHDVPAGHASRMLAHPDVFRLADGEALSDGYVGGHPDDLSLLGHAQAANPVTADANSQVLTGVAARLEHLAGNDTGDDLGGNELVSETATAAGAGAGLTLAPGGVVTAATASTHGTAAAAAAANAQAAAAVGADALDAPKPLTATVTEKTKAPEKTPAKPAAKAAKAKQKGK